jgi:hypothetical protein
MVPKKKFHFRNFVADFFEKIEKTEKISKKFPRDPKKIFHGPQSPESSHGSKTFLFLKIGPEMAELLRS